MSDNLPMGWIDLPLELVGMPSTPNIDPSKFPNEIFELYSVPSYTDDEPEILPSSEIHSTKQSVEMGDVLLCKIVPHLNRVWIVKELLQHRQIASGEWIVIRSKIAISDYLRYALTDSNFRSAFMATSSGVGGSLMRARPKAVAQIPIPIAPLNEQRRIVDKLERIGDRHRTARNELSHIPKLIARYKQAVLAAGCSGKLTEDWRCNNLDIDSASNLLEKTLSERRYLADILESNKRKSKYKEPIMFTGEIPFEIPENWAWVSADQVSSQITDGEHIQPPYQVEGLPMLSAKHVRDGYVEMSDLKFISKEDFEKAALRCYPKNGDILIVSVGATTGRAAIVSDCPPFVIVRSVLLLKPLIEAKFIYYWINSPFCQDWISKASGASAQPHFYINDNKRMPIPLPPEKELQEIVRRVEKMFEKIDRMEQEYQKAAKLCDRLEQATLAKAFRGELVSQDPDDEPASVLLEQVKREKHVQPKGKSVKSK